MDTNSNSIMATKNVLDLSDEILLHIVLCIDIGDIIHLSATCIRFDRLLQDITICRKIVIPWNCGVQRKPLLHFLLQPDRASVVTYLNLNDVYWIPSFVIRDVVLKMKFLQELHVAGASLSWKHLSQILSTLNLTALSWTWDDNLEALIRPRKNLIPPEPLEIVWSELLSLKDKFQLLRSLLVYIPDGFNSTQLIMLSYGSLCYLISLCTNLEELWIFSSPKTDHERKHSLLNRIEEFHPQMQFPRLHTFVLSVIEPAKIHIPSLTFQIIHSFQMKDDTSKEEQNGRNCSVVRNLWLDHPLLDVDLRRPTAPMHRNIKWPVLNFESLNRFCLPLTDGVVEKLNTSDLKKCKHLLITLGFNRVISLNKLLQEATQLESFRSTAFNYRLDWEEFISSHPKLTAINISEANEADESAQWYPNACIQIGRLHHLRQLSLSLYCLFEIKSEILISEYLEKLRVLQQANEEPGRSSSTVSAGSDQGFSGKKRESRHSTVANLNSISSLDYLTVFCPSVEEFEIGFTQREAGGKLLTNSLNSIGRWKNLRRLTLDGVPVLTGQFLVDIAKKTRCLESLRIKDLGPGAKCVYTNSLYAALKYLPKLKDFRLEQKYIGSLNPLFQALESCPKLERLFVYSSSNDRPLETTSSTIFRLMAKCSKLFVIYINVGSATKAACRFLRKRLESLYKISRPAVNIVIQNNMDEDVIQFEQVHYRDLVCFSPSVCSYHVFPTGD